MEDDFLHVCALGGDVHVHLAGIVGVQVIAFHRLGENGGHPRLAFLREGIEYIAGLVHVFDRDGDGIHGPHIVEFHPGGGRAFGGHIDFHLGGAVRRQGEALKRGRIDQGYAGLVGFLHAAQHVAPVVQAHHFHRGGLHRRAVMELHGVRGAAAVGVHGDIRAGLAHALHAGGHIVVGVYPAVLHRYGNGGFGDDLAGHGVDVAHGHRSLGDLRELGLGFRIGQGGGRRLGGDIQPQGGGHLAQGVKGRDFHIIHARLQARVQIPQLRQGQALRGDLRARHQGEAGILARPVGDGQAGVRLHRVLGRVQPEAVFIAGGLDGAGRAESGQVVPRQADGDRQGGHFGPGGNQAAQGAEGQQGTERQRAQPADQIAFQSRFHKRLLGRKITK